MEIYCIFDKKAMTYLPPFMVVNDEINAVRNVIMTVNSPGNTISQWPEDYCLMKLGEFNSRTGRIVQEDVLPVIGECLAYVRPDMNARNGVPGMVSGNSPAAEERQ